MLTKWAKLCSHVSAIVLFVSGQPTVTPDDNPVRVLAPGTITLTCKVKSETDIVWEHKGNRLPEGGKYNISILKKSVGGGMESTSTLRVVNPTSEDQGQYSCFDKNSPGERASKIVKVLQGKPACLFLCIVKYVRNDHDVSTKKRR